MKAEQFCFWLQGHIEMNPDQDTLTEDQYDMLKRHLALVFVHDIDPKMGNEKHQTKLNEIHHGDGKLPLMRC